MNFQNFEIVLRRFLFWTHVTFKMCQYATIKDKMCQRTKKVAMKETQGALQNAITWMNKSSKGQHEWEKACVEVGSLP